MTPAGLSGLQVGWVHLSERIANHADPDADKFLLQKQSNNISLTNSLQVQ